MGAGRLARAVYVQDPCSREMLILEPGEHPAPEVAVLITNPEAWECPPDVVLEGIEVVSDTTVEAVEVVTPEGDASGGEPAAPPAKKNAQRRARSSAT